MIVTCYYSPVEGGHPSCDTSLYDDLWPIMLKSCARLGYKVVHLTTKDAEAKTDNVVRYDLDPEKVMFSREVAWLRFLESMGNDTEQVVLVEPDAILRKPIPPLTTGDVMFLRRPNKNEPCGFRLATRKAAPLYERIVSIYSTLTDADKRFHGDVNAHHQALGIRDATTIPSKVGSVNIEVRNWEHYTTAMKRADAVAWNFKGTSKPKMLRFR